MRLEARPPCYRARETIALSLDEAHVLSERWARRAAALVSLDEPTTRRLSDLVRDACARVFREHQRRKAFDGRKLDARLREEVAATVPLLRLPPADAARLLRALADETR